MEEEEEEEEEEKEKDHRWDLLSSRGGWNI